MTDSTVAITPGGHRRATLAVAITIADLRYRMRTRVQVARVGRVLIQTHIC